MIETKVKLKLDIIKKQMINEYSFTQLAKKGIMKLLIDSLSIEDCNLIQANAVYFFVSLSPASQLKVRVLVPIDSNLIFIDGNCFDEFSEFELTSILLHEIGHSLNPDLKSEKGEFNADDYAVKRGYKKSIISSLLKCIEKWPRQFDKKIHHSRILRLQEDES